MTAQTLSVVTVTRLTRSIAALKLLNFRLKKVGHVIKRWLPVYQHHFLFLQKSIHTQNPKTSEK